MPQPHRIALLLIALFFFLLLPGKLLAQRYRTAETFSAMMSAYFELAGNGDTYSFNLEQLFLQNAQFKTGLRIGIGSNFFFLSEEDSTYPIVPVEAVALMGRRSKHFEFGLGYTRRFTDNPDLLHDMYFGRLGFRYQQPGGGLLVRVALTPFLSTETNIRTPGPALVPRFGISIGRSF